MMRDTVEWRFTNGVLSHSLVFRWSHIYMLTEAEITYSVIQILDTDGHTWDPVLIAFTHGFSYTLAEFLIFECIDEGIDYRVQQHREFADNICQENSQLGHPEMTVNSHDDHIQRLCRYVKNDVCNGHDQHEMDHSFLGLE